MALTNGGTAQLLRAFLREHRLIADGAMGTYYAQLTGKDPNLSELANREEPEVIGHIHRAYIEAGAQFIRTNTFSANTIALGLSQEETKTIIERGYALAWEAAQHKEVFVAADLGPLPEMVGENVEVTPERILAEYRFLIDIFLELGAEIFVLETLSSTEYLREVTAYLKERKPSAFILTQFATTVDGYTRRGISLRRIIEEVRGIPSIDVYGFNCGAGPTHLYQFLRGFDFTSDIVSVMPNAGYPEIVHQRTVYTQNPDYFSQVMASIAQLGVKILGGCCGTTPLHITKIKEKLAFPLEKQLESPPSLPRKVWHMGKITNSFREKLLKNRFPVVVELDPPFDTDMEKILEGAALLKQHGVDAITVADSPLARPRLNSLIGAAKIKREVGIEVIPHLSCRDYNLIGLKSLLLAAYVEGIRNLLIVTGDPVPGTGRSTIKGVFNFNSLTLMNFVGEMNRELFHDDPLFIGGALNVNSGNQGAETLKMERKIRNGAQFFLTQPIFTEEAIAYLAELKKRYPTRILGGILPLVSYRNAQFLNNEIPGITIPPSYLTRFREDMSRTEAEEVGIAIACELMALLRQHVDGFYLMTPFNRVSLIITILKVIGPLRA